MVCKPVLVLQTIGLEAETEPDFIIPVSLQLAECPSAAGFWAGMK